MKGTKAAAILPHVKAALGRAALAIALVTLKYWASAPALVEEALRKLR